jgi:hypothetical protein
MEGGIFRITPLVLAWDTEICILKPRRKRQPGKLVIRPMFETCCCWTEVTGKGFEQRRGDYDCSLPENDTVYITV